MAPVSRLLRHTCTCRVCSAVAVSGRSHLPQTRICVCFLRLPRQGGIMPLVVILVFGLWWGVARLGGGGGGAHRGHTPLEALPTAGRLGDVRPRPRSVRCILPSLRPATRFGSVARLRVCWGVFWLQGFEERICHFVGKPCFASSHSDG